MKIYGIDFTDTPEIKTPLHAPRVPSTKRGGIDWKIYKPDHVLDPGTIMYR